MFYLYDLISALTSQTTPSLDVPISGAVIDSRQASEGSLFIALPGEKADGHQFLQAAFDNGAAAALVDQDVNLPDQTLDLRQPQLDIHNLSLDLPVCLRVDNTLDALQRFASTWRDQHPVRTIGITGSVGKTSTKELTASLLSHRYQVLKNPGNRNNEIGLPLTLLELEPQHECAVLEMGFYVPGEIRTLCEIAKPQVGVITNIGTVHAERAGSQEIIAQGKAELVEELPPAPEGTAILNQDDPWVRWMFDKTQARIFSYGIKESADLTAVDIETLGLEGVACTLIHQGKKHPVRSPLLGEFSVYTILCAAAAALVEGMSWDAIESALQSSHFDLRLHHRSLSNGATILDDTYNASPESTIAALKFLQSLDGRRVAVLGDMLELGQYELAGHQSVGEFAAKAVDVLILVGPRSKTIAESAMKAGFPSSNLQWYPDSNQAAQPTAEIIQKDDMVLIKGSNSMRMDIILQAVEEAD